MIGWGLALVVVGLLLGLFGATIAAPLQWVGWLLLVVGIVLAIVHAVSARPAPRRY